MKVPLLDLTQQYQTIKDEITSAINGVCDSQIFALGPVVAEFEEKIAEYCGCKYAVGVSSGTDALLIALMAIGIQPGDEVITTAFTFFATAGSIARLGAKPVFADIEEDSFNIAPAEIEKKITQKTRAIIPVHLYGQAVQIEQINEIAKKHNLYVIEDAAQAIGAERNDVNCGGMGALGCFSFYPTKNLGGYGDGGLVTTNNPDLASKLKNLRDHGQNPRYFYKLIGGNFRLDALQAAVLLVKLAHLEQWNEQRRRNAAMYDKMFAGSAIKAPKTEAGNKHIYHQYTIVADRRDDLQKYLADNQVGSAIFYPLPLHLQECFSSLGYEKGDFPVAESVAERVLSLPIYPELSAEQIEFAAECALKFYEK